MLLPEITFHSVYYLAFAFVGAFATIRRCCMYLILHIIFLLQLGLHAFIMHFMF